MLPKIKTVHYTVELPKSGKIEYRPFLLKEEGAILSAIEFGKKEDYVATIKSLVKDCLYTEINIDDLLMTEFIYLLILLRTKSKSSNLELLTVCNSCEKQFSYNINLDTQEFFVNKEKLKVLVEVNSDLALEIGAMKTEDLELTFSFEDSENKIEATLEILSRLISKIIYEKKIYTEFTPNEVKENVFNNLTSAEFEKLTLKMKELIQFKMESEAKCIHCGEVNIRVNEDPLSFLF